MVRIRVRVLADADVVAARLFRVLADGFRDCVLVMPHRLPRGAHSITKEREKRLEVGVLAKALGKPTLCGHHSEVEVQELLCFGVEHAQGLERLDLRRTLEQKVQVHGRNGKLVVLCSTNSLFSFHSAIGCIGCTGASRDGGLEEG